MQADVKNLKGETVTTVELPAEIFEAPINKALMHQALVRQLANARLGTHSTKRRGEVSGGGKKPWKQKGTGRARHGSTRSPIWVGGGTTHGPRAERDYSVKINRKMRAAAFASLLSRKWKDGEVVFVEKLDFKKPATKEAKTALVAVANGAGVPELATKRANAAVIALASKDTNAERSFRNIGSLETVEARNLNPLDLATKKFVVIENPAETLPALASRLAHAPAKRVRITN